MADGSIRIDTRLNNGKLGGDLEQFKKQIDTTVKQVERDVINSGKAIDNLTKKFNDVNQELAETYAKMDEIANTKMEFAGVGNVSGEQLLQADANYQKLVQKADQLNAESEEYKGKITDAKIRQTELNNELTKAKEKQTEINNKIEDAKNRTELLKGSTDSVSKSLSKGIKKILVYAGALLSIRSVYYLLRSAMNEWLNSSSEGARQLKTDIAYMKYAIGNALSPVLKWVVDTLYKILGLVGAIIKVFTGINIFAGATADSFSSMASSASSTTKELKKQLAGFDSINKLEKQDSSGSGGSGGAGLPSQDLSELSNKYLDKAKELKEIIEAIALVLGAISLTKLLSDLNILKGNQVWQFLMGIIALGTAVKLEIDFLTSIKDGDFSIENLLKGLFASVLAGVGVTLTAVAFGCGWALAIDLGVIVALGLSSINIASIAKDKLIKPFTDKVSRLLSKIFGNNTEVDWSGGVPLVKISPKLSIDGLLESVSAREEAESLGLNVSTGISSGIIAGDPGLCSTIVTTVGKIITWFENLLGIHSPSTVMKNRIGTNIVKGIMSGMDSESKEKNTFTVINSVVNTILNWFKKLLGIDSSSRVMKEQVGTNIVKGINDGISNEKTEGTITTKSSGIKSLFASLLSRSNFDSIGRSIVSGINAGVANENTSGTITSKSNSIKTLFSTSLSSNNFISTGANIVSGIKTGITNTMSSLRTTINTLGSNVSSWLKSKLGIHSPSKVMKEQVGKWIPLGIKEGIEDESKSVYNAISDLTKIPKIGLNSIKLQPNRVIQTSNIVQTITQSGNMLNNSSSNTQRNYTFIAELDGTEIFRKVFKLKDEQEFATNGGVS